MSCGCQDRVTFRIKRRSDSLFCVSKGAKTLFNGSALITHLRLAKTIKA